MIESDHRFRVTYLLTCEPDEHPEAKARDLALEQTVELPASCLTPDVARDMVGRIEALEPRGPGAYRAVIAFPAATVGRDLLQYINLLFGNISLKKGVLITDIEVPPVIRETCGGPSFGIGGLRELCAAAEPRPLLCAAAKPVGLSSSALANICYEVAVAGIDIVKDDHGLADQPSAPFRERVERCQEAVTRANATTGGRTIYVPHLAVGGGDLWNRLEVARKVGCRAVLLSPLLIGLDTVREFSHAADVAVLAHPALTGAYFRPEHGIAPEVFLGTLFRLIGCDGVIYPNVGGRFPFTRAECEAINQRLREPVEGLRPAFPIPAGGISVERVPHWVQEYGPDTILLIGASLYEQPKLRKATEALVHAARVATLSV